MCKNKPNVVLSYLPFGFKLDNVSVLNRKTFSWIVLKGLTCLGLQTITTATESTAGHRKVNIKLYLAFDCEVDVIRGSGVIGLCVQGRGIWRGSPGCECAGHDRCVSGRLIICFIHKRAFFFAHRCVQVLFLSLGKCGDVRVFACGFGASHRCILYYFGLGVAPRGITCLLRAIVLVVLV